MMENLDMGPISLLDIKKGGVNQGSWIHPDLAIQLAQWISPKFVIQVSKWIINLFTNGKVEINTQLVTENKLFDGIIPKIDNAFDAIDNGVKEVLIGDADDLIQNCTSNTIGTLIK